jgi:hypothetical protein
MDNNGLKDTLPGPIPKEWKTVSSGNVIDVMGRIS